MQDSIFLPRIKGSATVVIVCLLAISVAAGVFAFNFSLLKTTDGIRLISKSDKGFNNLYVDASSWSLKDLFANPALVRDITQAGYSDELPQVKAFHHAVSEGINSVREFSDRYGVVDAANTTVRELKQFDERYRISERASEAHNAIKETAGDLDERYQIRERATEVADAARDNAANLWNRVKGDDGG